MLSQVTSLVLDMWEVEDVERQLRRYGVEVFRSALEALQDIDPRAINGPSRLFIKTLRDIAIQCFKDKGVTPSLLSKIPGSDPFQVRRHQT